MTRILRLLQIKTVRSAWTLLLGAGLLFLFGAYQLAMSPSPPADEPRALIQTAFPVLWFLVTGAYMALASWSLFTAEGRQFLAAEQAKTATASRGALWVVKFFFACYAAAFATLMLLGVLALPFIEPAGLDTLLSHNAGLYLLTAGMVWSPLVFRYLK